MERVKVGFFSFTEVPAGAHRAYNAWHQFDHLPEQYRLPGIAHGERWVASPDCVAARPVDDPLVGSAQYVTLYLISDPVDETLRRFGELAVEMRDLGRFFEKRSAPVFGGWHLAATAASPRIPVSPSVIPWHPASGVFVLAEPAAGADDELAVLAGLVEVDGVIGGWTFVPGDEELSNPSWLVQPWRLTVLWLDGDPPAAAERLAPRLPAATLFAAPYRAVTPGEWGWFD
jgi:hypothetical protein